MVPSVNSCALWKLYSITLGRQSTLVYLRRYRMAIYTGFMHMVDSPMLSGVIIYLFTNLGHLRKWDRCCQQVLVGTCSEVPNELVAVAQLKQKA